MTTQLLGSFTATGRSASAPIRPGKFNYSIGRRGVEFVGAVALERTFDGGTTWWPCSFADGSLGQWTSNAGDQGEEIEGEDGSGSAVLYSFYCSAHTSGTIWYRLGQ